MKTSPWARRQARRALVQALYQWHMSGTKTSQIGTDFEANGSLKKADRTFFFELLEAVVAPLVRTADEELEHSGRLTATPSCAIDVHFAGYLDRGTKELDKVELSILRLGAFELVHRIDVPFRVVIDEYVELTKTFGAEEAHKYVNGVLDKVAAEARSVEVQAKRQQGQPES